MDIQEMIWVMVGVLFLLTVVCTIAAVLSARRYKSNKNKRQKYWCMAYCVAATVFIITLFQIIFMLWRTDFGVVVITTG